MATETLLLQTLSEELCSNGRKFVLWLNLTLVITWCIFLHRKTVISNTWSDVTSGPFKPFPPKGRRMSEVIASRGQLGQSQPQGSTTVWPQFDICSQNIMELPSASDVHSVKLKCICHVLTECSTLLEPNQGDPATLSVQGKLSSNYIFCTRVFHTKGGF